MENAWGIILAATLFSILMILFYKLQKHFVIKSFGQKWLTSWGNQLYFWQSLIFASTAFAITILFLFRWGNVISF